ncbi:MAG: TIM barrel protein [Clostridiales bacterium]|jgi:deoxyribonuclease-4|nr:TIM barrel protein [Clostridiales bacterium]
MKKISIKGVFLINIQIRFGPSGNDNLFYKQGYRSSIDMPKWLYEMGLNAYEYSLTRGIHIEEHTAKEIGEQAAKWGISMSVHAPYYINLASQKEENRLKSIQYIVRSAEVALWIGANRVVFHPGSSGKDRESALETAKKTLLHALEECGEYIANGIRLCPETMGKRNQLGNLGEVLELCQLDNTLLPVIDFGHLHALYQGAIKSVKEYANILDMIENKLDKERNKSFHIHFSRIEYTKAGEKKHHAYENTAYGPDFEPLAEIIIHRNIKPVIICESRGSMARDALKLKRIYEEKLSLFNASYL